MLPKRKLIKKPRHENKQSSMQETQLQQNPQSLMQRLKSPIPQVKQQAISVIANLRCMLPELSSQQFLREMINILYQSNTTLCHQTLYAIVNLCQLQPKTVNRMFSFGLDKALINLQASSQNLLKPLLVFFIGVNEHINHNYRYLVDGIRQSLTVSHIKASPQLCLQFLYRTRGVNNNKSNKLSHQLLSQILAISKNTQSPSAKSYSIAILSYQLLPEKNIQQLLISHLTQQLTIINIQQQYDMNFPPKQQKKHHTNKQQQMNQMQQDNNNNNLQKEQQQTIGQKQKMKYFLSVVSGIQVLLQFVLDVMQSQTNKQSQTEWDQQQQDDQDQQIMEKQLQHQQKSSSIQYLQQLITSFLHQNMPIFPKFLSTTAPGTQNLVYLFYHLLLQTAKTLPQSTQTKQQINRLIQVSLTSLFTTVDTKRQTLSYEQYQVLVQCLQIGLGVIMKHKSIGVSDEFLLQFSKKYMLQASIFESSKLLQMLRPSWLIMLQIFSLRYNPEKNHCITKQHNYILGEMLKYLIVSLPYSELQQLRCQVVDTVFDVYSNEQFDDIFVQLGYFQLLQHIIQQGSKINTHQKSNNKKKNKQQKFILDVIKDTKRFLQYKNKMIKHKQHNNN